MGGRDDCWYEGGLTFSCKRCGDCCRGEPGYVWVTGEEVGEIAEYLGMEVGEFGELYLRKAYGRRSLVELENGDCIFYGGGGCKIYPVRPVQCRTFPFWPENVRSSEAWLRLKRRCPGVGEGELHSREEVESAVRRSRR